MLTIPPKAATMTQLLAALAKVEASAQRCNEQGLTHTWDREIIALRAEISRRRSR